MIKKNYHWVFGLLLAILLTGLLFYLNVSRKNPMSPYVDIEYQNELKLFDSKFTNHFPKEIESNNTSYSTSHDISISHPGIWLKTIVDEDNFDTLLNYLQKKSIAKYSTVDTCLLIVDQHLTEKNHLDYDKNLRNSQTVDIPDKPCHKDKHPIPNFWRSFFHETNDTQVGLEKTYSLFVLESEKGMFMDVEKLPNGKYTPKDWEHGYTKGVAMDKDSRTVIYWFDIW